MKKKPLILFMKAADIPAGSKWITVHPNGPDTKGQPVLVQPVEPGSHVLHVIGGAGGKLNYMRITSTKSPEDYAKESGERAKAKREAAKAQKAADKAAGVHEAKQQAKAEVSTQQRAAERDFIDTVAKAMGWDDSALAFDEAAHAGVSDAARATALRQHHAELLKRAKEAVGLQRQRLLIDADARKQAFTGETPLHTDDATKLGVSDIDPVRPNTGKGFDPDYAGRAKDKGLTPEAAEAEAAEVQGKQAAGAKDKSVAQKVAEELAKVNADKPDLPAKIVEVQQAVDLLAAQKKLAAIQQAARAANQQIDASPEPHGYVLKVSDVDPAAVEKEVLDKLNTAKTSAFLKAAAETGKETPLEHHIAAGSFNSLNALALAAGGAPLMDRSVVDVLGAEASAQILARRLRKDLGDDKADEIADGMGGFHLQHYQGLQESVLADVAKLHETAAQLEIDAAHGPADLLVKAEANRRRMAALDEANHLLGHALGEMEANAAMVYALGEPSRDAVQVSLGKTPLVSAIQQLRAIGLEKGDYSLQQEAGNAFLTIHASGMDRLAGPVDAAGLEQVQRNLGIMKGSEDEDGWLPEGFDGRADLALNLEPGVAPSLAQPFDGQAEDLHGALRDYIGSRMADGDAPADIVSDLQSAAFFAKVGADRADDYRAALDAVAPNKGSDGKQMVRAEQLAPLFDKYADEFVASKWGGKRSTLNKQGFEADDHAQEALHRALAAEPAGVAAYKPIGELHDGDTKALRDYFYKHIAKESPELAAMRAEYDDHLKAEPEKTVEDLFGEIAPNPDWQAWDSARTALAGKIKQSGLNWQDYTKTMRGHQKAYETLQDLIRSKVSSEFARHYNTLKPDAPLKLGKTVVRGNLNHLDAVDPAAREARVKAERQLIDTLRERHAGKYTSGSVAGKLEAAKEAKAAFEQSQMGFFSSEEAPAALSGDDGDIGNPISLGADERHTIGQAAEHKLAAMMGVVGKNFVPGQPTKLFAASMSGKDGIKRQRAIKMLLANKRMIGGLGVGSGKTGIGLGAFAHLKSTGKAKKGLFVVPSIVQGQFGGEALRFLKAGQFNWHCQPGASHEERLASYKDAGTDFHVVTHQAFRDDVLKLAAKHEGSDPEKIAAALDAMDAEGRKHYIKDILDKEGIGFDYVMADEGHGLLNREGKENSRLSNVVQGVTDSAEYYLHASGDPVKNDASEAFDLLAKMDGKRYHDRAAFMRRYGGDSQLAKDGLRRELARYAYLAKITPDVNVTKTERHIELHPEQHAALDAIDRAAAKVRIARMNGGVDLPALQELSPESFHGAPEEQHAEIAQALTKAIGVIKNAAINRVINAHPKSAKLDDLAQTAGERKGKPGVVFARSLAAVEQAKARLEAAGHRVAVITGADSAKDKGAKIQQFNPDDGDRKADIVICSDAGAVGANLQSGSWLYQMDTPDTAMVHEQRNGRIARVGQKNDVELIDAIANHPQERRARERLAKKGELRRVVTDPLDGIDDTGLAAFLSAQNHAQQQSMLF
jgi:hypothetical protein